MWSKNANNAALCGDEGLREVINVPTSAAIVLIIPVYSMTKSAQVQILPEKKRAYRRRRTRLLHHCICLCN